MSKDHIKEEVINELQEAVLGWECFCNLTKRLGAIGCCEEEEITAIVCILTRNAVRIVNKLGGGG